MNYAKRIKDLEDEISRLKREEKAYIYKSDHFELKPMEDRGPFWYLTFIETTNEKIIRRPMRIHTSTDEFIEEMQRLTKALSDYEENRKRRTMQWLKDTAAEFGEKYGLRKSAT